MTQNENHALEGNQGAAADYSVLDVHRRDSLTLASQLSPPRRLPETALAAAYAEALRRREGRS